MSRVRNHTARSNAVVPTVPSYRFVTATADLDQFKDRTTLKDSRSHVMHNHIAMYRRDVPSAGHSRGVTIHKAPQDIPCGHEASVSSQQSTDSETPDSFISNEDALALYWNVKSQRKRSSPRSDVEDGDSQSQSSGAIYPQPAPLSRYHRTMSGIAGVLKAIDISQSLVQAPDSAVGPYLLAFSSPPPFKSLGSSLDPFHSLPEPSDPRVSFITLKIHCCRYFGNKAMGVHWTPTCVSSPQSYLSTLCVSSPHLDAMQGAFADSYVTTAMKTEVINLITESINDPHGGASDLNIMAVTQLMCGEIIGGDARQLSLHEHGIRRMVEIRGGLHTLGIDGELATVLTATSIQSAIFRECQPHPIYLRYLSNIQQPHYTVAQPIPESPLFCPHDDFYTIVRSRHCSERTFELLCDAKDLTELTIKLQDGAADNRVATVGLQGRIKNQIHAICEKIFALPSIQDTGKTESRDWTYEACRIAAVIYATAISQQLPLSLAASFTNTTGLHSTNSSTASLTDQLKTALAHTDHGSCWDDMAGVLFWVTLVGGAAARGRLERKWLVAIAIRCNIVLVFEHGPAVIGALRALLKVMEVLSGKLSP